jgi:uncharacterized protein YjhX (UPF0386 family)
MEKAGYLPIATSVALRRLARRGFVDQFTKDDGHDTYRAVIITREGWQWIEDNLERFTLKVKRRPVAKRGDMDDEIPF